MMYLYACILYKLHTCISVCVGIPLVSNCAEYIHFTIVKMSPVCAQAKCDFYMDNMATFRQMKKKLGESSPPEVLEFIQRVMDKNVSLV